VYANKNIIRTYFWRVLVLFNSWFNSTFDSRTRLRFRCPKIASWFADFPYCGRALYCTLCVWGNALSEVMTPRETMAVTHTFPRFRIAIFHLVSHALPLAHRSVNCDVLSPTSSSPLYRFFLVSKRSLCPFAIYRVPNKQASSFLSGRFHSERVRSSSEIHACSCGFPKMLPEVLHSDIIDEEGLTKGIVCTIVRKCLPIVYRVPQSVIHSHTTIIVDNIMFGQDRRERDKAVVTAVRLESIYGARIIKRSSNLFNVNVFNFPFMSY